MKSSKRTLVLAIATLPMAATAAYLFLSAVTTASLRFGYCGPTSLSHVDPTCRVGEALLLWSYAFGAITVLLAVAALWSYTRSIKRPNHSFKPTAGDGRDVSHASGPAAA